MYAILCNVRTYIIEFSGKLKWKLVNFDILETQGSFRTYELVEIVEVVIIACHIS